MVETHWLGNLNTCVINQTIEVDSYIFGSEVDTTVEQIYISDNKGVKYLPRNIGKNFPNLKGIRIWICGLSVVRNFYFKNMRNLKYLSLYKNKVVTIESEAFKDLISVRWFGLSGNMIETLHGKLFTTMVNLMQIHLNDNKIKFMSPTTFAIPVGELMFIGLEGNVCIDTKYSRQEFEHMKAYIRANCSR